MEDGKYAADTVGYLVSVLNNELTVIDVPQLASRDLESRQLERNTDLLPPTGTEIIMVVEPAGKKDGPAKEVPKPAADPVQQSEGSGDPNAVPAGRTIAVAIDNAGRVSIDGQPVELDALAAKLESLKTGGPPAIANFVSDPGARRDIIAKVEDTLKNAGVRVQSATARLTDVAIDEAKIKALRKKWEEKVAPRNAALREAAQRITR